MFLSDPPESDLAEAQYDEERASEGYVMNATRLWGWRPDVHEAFFGVRSLLSSGSSLSPADLAVLFAATAAARSDSYCGLAWGTRLAGHTGRAPRSWRTGPAGSRWTRVGRPRPTSAACTTLG